jgi:hypothetical protein
MTPDYSDRVATREERFFTQHHVLVLTQIHTEHKTLKNTKDGCDRDGPLVAAKAA